MALRFRRGWTVTSAFEATRAVFLIDAGHDRLRVLVAEYGEAMVRPVRPASQVNGTLAARCRAYEIGHGSGPALLEMLSLDAATASPDWLLRAIVGASPGPPAPGTTGG